jgi:V/A-type H+-transporting ATPase subunit I
MLVKMKKASIVGLAKGAPEITVALQELGVVDIIELNPEIDATSIDRLQSEKNTILSTLKYLANKPVTEADTKGKKTPAEIIQETAGIRARLEAMQEDRRKYSRQIETWSLFGDFDPQQVLQLKAQGVHVQFFKTGEATFSPALAELAEYDLKIISQEAQKIFFLTVGLQPLQTTLFEELALPDYSLDSLQRKLAGLVTEQEALEKQLSVLAAQKKQLSREWIQTENQYNFQKAVAHQVIEGELFYLQGWIPESKTEVLQSAADKNNFILLLEEPLPDENPPTTHKNNTAGELGESLIYIYDTPAYRDLDPSSTVFLFFSVFFGMIIADAGYGMLLLALTLGLIRGNSDGAKIFRRLSLVTSLSTILFGILTAGYFAIKIDSATSLGKFLFSIAPLYRDAGDKSGLMSAMFISLWVGVINLSWVNLYKAYHSKKLSVLGWIPALIGLIPLFKLLFGVEWTGWEKVVGLYPLYGGLLFVAVFTAIETQASIGGKFGAFGYALYTVVQLVADLLSFLRIFALAMAGAKMAETFNMLFRMILDGGGVLIGFTVGLLVLIIGHAINLILNIMGGVIHGLRLNFIESYHWCLDGGGKQYKPLKKLEIESH